MRPTLLRNILFLSLALLLFVAAHAQASVNVDSLYALAEQANKNGDFLTARYEAMAALHYLPELTVVQACRFYEVLGSAFVGLDQRDEAFREFKNLYQLDISWKINPEVSPKIKEVAKEAYLEVLTELQRPDVERLTSAELKFGASWRSAVLPGWGQFYKGQKVRGTAFMATQLLSLVALAVLQSEVNRQHDEYMGAEGAAAANAYGDYRNAWRTRNVVGYIAVGIYVATYLDALYSPPARK